MCLADRCSLVVFTESTLAMGSIGPLRDVTGHQLFSRRRQVEAKFEVLWTRLGPVVSNALHLWTQHDSKPASEDPAFPISLFSLAQVWLTFVTLYWGLEVFALVVPAVSASSLEFARAV